MGAKIPAKVASSLASSLNEMREVLVLSGDEQQSMLMELLKIVEGEFAEC